MEFCLDAAKDCFLDRPCRAALQCLSGCDVIEDDTPDKIILQNCTAACVVTYENAALDAVNGCFDAHDCITLDPIDLPCRDTTEAGACLGWSVWLGLTSVVDRRASYPEPHPTSSSRRAARGADGGPVVGHVGIQSCL